MVLDTGKTVTFPGLKARSPVDATKYPFGTWDLDSDKPDSDPVSVAYKWASHLISRNFLFLPG